VSDYGVLPGDGELGDTQATLEHFELVNALSPVTVVAGEVTTIVHPANWVLERYDAERLLDAPRRARGTVVVHSAEGFVRAVHQRVPTVDAPAEDRKIALAGPIGLYADEPRKQLVGILNDDTPGAPGWRDERIQLQLQRTPEWAFWLEHAGLKDQQHFAETIEAGAREIADPPAATMLSIASTFEAKVNVRFAAGTNVVNGARQLVYEEDVEAKAGKGGQVVIPDKFKIVVAPFVGSDRFAVEAAIKFKVSNGKLSIGYILDRPHDVERVAFLDTTDKVAAALGVHQVPGVAPEAR
jgi:uncharacterized protein YfdQ (DUF2303 family)